MKLPIAASLALCACCCQADRFILSPVGKKLPFGAFKFEHLQQAGEIGRFTDHMGLGLTTMFDGEIVMDREPGRQDRISFDLAYNVTDPVVEMVPGVSFGVQDALNQTLDGRRFYWVTTYALGLDGKYNSRTPMEFTLGACAGSRTGALISASLPFTAWFRLLGEFDTGRITHGLELKPTRLSSVRYLLRDNQVYWSGTLEIRF